MAAVRGATAAEKREMGVKATDEEKKGSRAVEKGEKGATSGEAGKGATAEGKGVAAVDKGGKGSSSKATVKGKAPTAEGKGKKRETAEDEKDAAAEWKLKGPTAADEEEVPNPRRERLRPRSTRREGGAAVDRDQAGTAAASEVAGEKATFVFSAAAAAAPDAGKMITLVSSEGKVFKVSEDAARLSTVLADMIDNGCAGGDIPVPTATARALATVIKYCEKHADEPDPDHGGGSSSTAASDKETLAEWDRKLVDNLTTNALFDLLLASNFLDIKGLLGVASQKVADMIQSKTPAQVRTIFGIANDFTPEEEAKIRGESPWAYEDI